MRALQTVAMNILYLPRGGKIEPACELIVVTSEAVYNATAAGLAKTIETDTQRFTANAKVLREIASVLEGYAEDLDKAADAFPEPAEEPQ